MKTYKTAIFITSLAGGGAERVVSHIVQSMMKKNIPFVLFLMSKSISYTIPKGTPVVFLDNSSLKESGYTKLFKIPFIAIKLKYYLNRYKIKTIFE